MAQDSRQTLILICGFARSGKDTLATGILEWSRRRCAKANFADYLKDACNDYLWSLNMEGDFHNEAFKVKHRDFLVAAGKFARSIDRDIFARNLAFYLPVMNSPEGDSHEVVICTDWRYLNEHSICLNHLRGHDWLIRTVYVSTAGIGPANEEEADSILEIRGSINFDRELIFRPNSRQDVIAAGREIAREWNL